MEEINLNRGPVVHVLKIHPEPFASVWNHKKRAELRLDDRDYRIGDTLRLREFKPSKEEFTNREFHAEISDITRLSHWIKEPIDHRWVILHMNDGTKIVTE